MRHCPIAVLDACVLVPMPLADTLLRLAEPRPLFEARWSGEILAEVTRTLRNRFGKSSESAAYREQAMREHFPMALVTEYEAHIPAMRNHEKDRHVLAAAVACDADYLVTFNRRDFPTAATAGLRTRVVGPSFLLKQLWNHDPHEVRRRIAAQAEDIDSTVDGVLQRLSLSVPAFVELVRAH
jgi:predicted nucleic acid-binding protein